jgi:type I restriction enzyme, S subunit
MSANNEIGTPPGWIAGKLSDFVHPRGEKALPSSLPDATFLGMDHIEAHTTRIIGGVPASKMKSAGAKFYRGDVLYGRLRPYLNKVATPGFDGLASAEFIVFPDSQLLHSQFLKHRLNASDFVSFASHLNEGDRPRVDFDQIGAFPILLPPATEQRRIVAKIEELFSELDKGIESLTTAREQLKAYRQSVLKAAFEGKLTESWHAKHLEHVQSAADLEASLTTDGAVNAKHVPARDLQEVARLPEEWAYFRVASLCSVVRGGSPRPAGDPKYYDGHIPFLKVADLTRATGMYLSTHTSTIKEAGLAKTRMTPPNTLLISNSGATLGVPKICTFEATFNDGVAAFLAVPEGYLEYFYFFWESKTARLRGIDQGAAQPNLNTSILGETLIPICSKGEARALVELLKALLSNIERQSDEIDRNLAQAAALRQSILKRAFSGQLVAQDATDEPASVLLERIRAERDENGATKRRNNKNGKKEAA